jgi:hypothetical protein
MITADAAKPAPAATGNGLQIDQLGGSINLANNQSQSEKQDNPKSRGPRFRRKGYREERRLVVTAQENGFDAVRVPLSGSAGGRFCGDILFPLLGRELVVESKIRGHGFRQLYQWLENRDVLVVRAGRRQSLVVIPMKLALKIAKAAARGR